MNIRPDRIIPPDDAAKGMLRPVPRRSLLRFRLFFYFVALDTACIVLSFGLAPPLHAAAYTNSRLELILPVMLAVYGFTALNSRAYSVELINRPFRAVALGLRSFALTLALMGLIAFGLKTSAAFSRLTLGIGTVLSLVSLTGARYFFVRNTERILGGNPLRVVLLRDQDQPIPPGNWTIVDTRSENIDPERHDPVMYDRLAKILESADRVVVACSAERRMAWVGALKGSNVQSEILLPDLTELAPLGIGRHGSGTSVIVSNGPLKLFDRFLKRGFDVATASAAIVLLSPILLLVAILIKIDSAGPIFFRQTRIGRGNEMFEMLKFRSMHADRADDAGDRSTGRDDDRITRIGSFMRKTSIDELPQLINVLRGEMSIVGPRPHALGSRAQDKLFWEIDSRYWHRHAAKPGLTGLAQIRGYRGATVYESDLTNRLQADLEYLNDWTIWRDFKIILQTFRVVFHRNAY